MLIIFFPPRNATKKTYKQLTYEQRCQIYALSKTRLSQNKIAKQLKVSQSTINREFVRNTGKRGYRFKQAQTSTDTHRSDVCKAIKMPTKTIELIELKISEKWSPEQVSGWLRENRAIGISYEIIYQHIWSDKPRGDHLFKHLLRKGKAYQSRSKDKQAGRGFIKNRIGIEAWPNVVDEKSRIGDWEIDLIIGKGQRAKGTVLTITADNGKEFAHHEKMTESLKCDVFFADPYCSWQRVLICTAMEPFHLRRSGHHHSSKANE